MPQVPPEQIESFHATEQEKEGVAVTVTAQTALSFPRRTVTVFEPTVENDAEKEETLPALLGVPSGAAVHE
jgi:hypothetical protein